MIEVGKFKFNTETNVLSGPENYMLEQGDAKLEEILSGKSKVLEAGFSFAGKMEYRAETLILVALQTDYAEWVGKKRLAA